MSPARRTAEARSRRRAGLEAEGVVEGFLVQRGWFPLARNHVVRGGEVDLVMQDGETVVFVEVKKRTRGGVDEALESVTTTKQRRILRAATDWLVRSGMTEKQVRFDVVALTRKGRGAPVVRHVEAAFDASVADGE